MKISFWPLALCALFLESGCSETGEEELLEQFTAPHFYEGEVDEDHLGIGVSLVEESFVQVVLEECEGELCAQFDFAGTFMAFGQEVEGPLSEYVDEGILLTKKSVSLVFEIEHGDKTYHLDLNGKFTDAGIEVVIRVDFFDDLMLIRVGKVELDNVVIPSVQ